MLTAAILHDTLEDTSATEKEIEALFGPRVLYTVKEVTNDPNLSKAETKHWQVNHALTMSLDGRSVKLADRLYNIKTLKAQNGWGRPEEKINWGCMWGEKLLNALRGTNPNLEKALEIEVQREFIPTGVTKNS